MNLNFVKGVGGFDDDDLSAGEFFFVRKDWNGVAVRFGSGYLQKRFKCGLMAACSIFR